MAGALAAALAKTSSASFRTIPEWLFIFVKIGWQRKSFIRSCLANRIA